MKPVAPTAKMGGSALQPSQSGEEIQIHPSVVIDPSVTLGEGVKIHAHVVIERGTRIGSYTEIHPGCYIGEDCSIGSQTVLMPLVTLREKTVVGHRVLISSGVVIGSDGFGYAKKEDGVNYKVPQVGNVIIEDDVQIGANATIDRATLGHTVVGRGSRVGALTQVGHNAVIGEETRVGDSVGICGSSKIGNHAVIGRGVGMVGHIRIGDHADVGNGSGVSKDVADGAKIRGIPAMEESDYAVFTEYLQKLPEFVARLMALERKIQSGEAEFPSGNPAV
ncbi:MAG: UDP-3-O-(3-hydroxymyristoyl)glucosamine N-acyltransferase [bacterium]